MICSPMSKAKTQYSVASTSSSGETKSASCHVIDSVLPLRLPPLDELVITGALLYSMGGDGRADALGAWIMCRAQPLERITLDGCCDRSGVFDWLVDKRAARNIVGTNWR
jgi:hypothetical protein